jgi:hypothetical protein
MRVINRWYLKLRDNSPCYRMISYRVATPRNFLICKSPRIKGAVLPLSIRFHSVVYL